MYTKGMATKIISAHLKLIYRVDSLDEIISRITDRLLPIAREWQNHSLKNEHVILFMDSVHFKVRQDN